MADLGRTLVVLGLIVAALGAVMMVLPAQSWIGRLPGDIHIESERFSLHVPLVTCLVVSVVLSLLLNLFFRR
jgi:Mg2+/citrate symporter